MPLATYTDLLASACRESFREFVKRFWKTFVAEKLVWNWHMDVFCKELQRVGERLFAGLPREYDLCVNVSPGTSKSSIFSVLFPAWCWTRMPSCRVLGASYAHGLATDLSRKCRDVVKSDLYRACFPEIQIRQDQDAKTNFVNTAGGMRYAVGANGTVQGIHFHVIIPDDPLDPNRATSDADLAAVNYWIKHTLSGRKIDKEKTVTCMVMQRLHQDDPTAQMVEKGGVRHVVLPATTEFDVKPAEYLDYYTEGLMDPVRLPMQVLDDLRKELGEDGFAGQYGQSPVPAGGGMFKTDLLRYGEPPVRFSRVTRFWDKAMTPEGGASSRQLRRAAYTAGVKVGLDLEGRYWVLDVIRGRWDSFSRELKIQRAAQLDGQWVEVGIEQEPGSAGKDSVIQTMKRLVGYRVRGVAANSPKEVRADEFSYAVNAGLVYLPQQLRQGRSWTGWARDFVDEMRHWPYSRTKDQIDAASGAYNLVVRPVIRIGGLTPSGQWLKGTVG